MKKLHYQIPNNLSLLHDELLAAIPSVAIQADTTGERYAVMQVEGNDNNIWLTVPDDADEVAIAAVVQAHDHTKQQPDPTTQQRTRIKELLVIGRSNWTASQRNELLELIARNCCPTVGFVA